MSYNGGKSAPGVIHTIGREMPPHRSRVELFGGSFPTLRLIKLAPGLNAGLDLDGKAIAEARNNPALERCIFHELDAVEWIESFPALLSEPDTLVYLDPPYLLSTRASQRPIYRHELMTQGEHRELLGLLLRLPCMAMISHYPCELYDHELRHWRRVTFQAIDRRGRKRTEALYCNFPEPVSLHDPRYAGANRRERWNLAKRKRSWTRKLQAMSSHERQAIREALAHCDAGNCSDAGNGVPDRPDAGNGGDGRGASDAGNGVDRGALVLSTFTGAGLLDRGFREAGFCLTSAGDAQFGQLIEDFHTCAGIFEGVIGGPPCQADSMVNRKRDPLAGLVLKREFFRVVAEAASPWFLMEGVNGLADVSELVPSGYRLQRLHVNARELGFEQNRERWFLFGYRSGQPLVLPYVTRSASASAAASRRCCIASEFNRKGRRSFPDFCELQGLPRSFAFPPGLSRTMQYTLIGNGVHVGVARILAEAIRDRAENLIRVCVCECGREVRAGLTMATAACRKRMQRRRERTF